MQEKMKRLVGVRLCWIVLVAVGVAVLCAASASADTIEYCETYASEGDVYDHVIVQISSGTAPSSSIYSAVGMLSSTAPLRSVNGFELTGIPSGSTIQSATLRVMVHNTEGGFGNQLELREITNTAAMVESETSWTAVNTTTNWTNPGGDFAGTALATISGPYGSGTYKTFASSTAFVAAVQSALDASRPFQSIILSPAREAAGGRAFVRLKGDDLPNLPSWRPLLTVEYVPEPATAILLGIGGLLTLVRRRRR